MKKYILVLLLVCINLSINPQVKIGIKGGVNSSSFTGDQSTIQNSRPISVQGLVAGITASSNITGALSLQAELLYSMQGARYKYPVDRYSDYDIRCSFHFIEIPLILKYDVPLEGSNISPYFYTGPMVGFKVYSKGIITYPGEQLTADFRNAQKSEFGFTFGVGLDFKVGESNIYTDFRYNKYFTGIFDISPSADVYSKSVAMTVGIAFDLRQ